MNRPATLVDRHTWCVAGSTVTLLGLAALAWVGSIAYGLHLGNGAGSMGMAWVTFLVMWTTMMAAMMLPAVVPVASRYAGSITSATRLAPFVVGYLLVWVAVGIPMYGALRIVDHVGTGSNATLRTVAFATLIVAGLYQVTQFKGRGLDRCRAARTRSSQGERVGAGLLPDLTAGLQHGVSCLMCSGALMALFIAFGVMNLWAMVGLAAVVVAERTLPRGKLIARSAGAACLVLALVVWLSPSTANVLVPTSSRMSSMTTGM